MIPTFPCPRRRAGAAVGAAVALATAGLAAASTEPPASEPDVSAAPAAGPDTGANPAGCVDDAESGAELFPDQFTVQHAENFSLTYAGQLQGADGRRDQPGRRLAHLRARAVRHRGPGAGWRPGGSVGRRDPDRHDVLRVDVAPRFHRRPRPRGHRDRSQRRVVCGDAQRRASASTPARSCRSTRPARSTPRRSWPPIRMSTSPAASRTRPTKQSSTPASRWWPTPSGSRRPRRDGPSGSDSSPP